MGTGPQYVIAQLNEDGVPVPVGIDNPLKISGGGGGGGAVDSVNGQTGAVVLTATDVGAVVSSAIASRVYGTGTVGEAATYTIGGGAATAWSLAQRGADGVLLVGTPTAATHATTKGYVDIRVPAPPATGTHTLQSVDGVTSWVESV